MKKHPIQPTLIDEHGTLRFKPNKIVQYLLDNNGKIGMNQLACAGLPKEDWVQFAQLIGYSVDGFGSLSYCDDETYTTAIKMAGGIDEQQARIEYLTKTLKQVKEGLKTFVPDLFGIHSDDLK